MPDDVGYPMPQTGPKTNPTGRGGALGLISSKLATGLARRKQKRSSLQTQKSQGLGQQAMGNQMQSFMQSANQTQSNLAGRRKKPHMSTSQAETMGLD